MIVGRRIFMAAAMAVGGVGITSPRALAHTGDELFFKGHGLPVGLQLYTLDPDLEADFAGTLDAVHRIGYRIVELAGFHGRTAEQVRAALNAAQLTCRSMHVQPTGQLPGSSLSGDMGEVAHNAHAIGVIDLVMPVSLAPKNFTPPAGAGAGDVFVAAARTLTADDYKRTADFLNDKARRLKAHGLRLSYHNHNYEFLPLAGDTNGLNILLAGTDPKLVSFELDVGWASAAGVDPIALLQTHSGRFTQMHVKDIKASTKPNFALQLEPTEVGSGAIDWKQILPVAYAEGVRRFYVEQEPPFVESRMVSVAKSYRYLAALRT